MRISLGTYFLVLSAGASAIQLHADQSEETWKTRPVAKVVKLLKEMSSALEEEGETDQEMYDKLACWCQKNEKEKTSAIEWGEAKVPEEQSTIEELTAKVARLQTQIDNLNVDIPKAQKGLADATAMREEESAEFAENEKETISTIATLKGAVQALQKHHPKDAFSQQSLVAVHKTIRRHQQVFGEKGLSRKLKQVLTMLNQQRQMGVDAYQPASGQIFGILEQMKETFEQNLATARTEETQARKEFSELTQSKEQEIEAAQADLTNKESELATAAETAAMTKQSLKDNQAALDADKEALANLRDQCAQGDREFQERSKSRTEETQAISETIAILSDEDAHDLISRSTFLLQISNRISSKGTASETHRRNIASWFLTHIGRQQHSSGAGLVQLGVQVKEDAIEDVTKSVDTMIKDVVQQRTDDAEMHEQCLKDLRTNKVDTDTATKAKQDAATSVADLTAAIGTLSDEIATLKAEVADMQSELKGASETREAENKEFQRSVSDQRATQAILAKAMDRMAAFYKKKNLLQVRSAIRQAPPGAPGGPPVQATYKKNEGGNSVLAMLEMIIADSKRVEQEAQKAEQDAQSAYEGYVTDSNAAIAVCQKDIMNRAEETARLEAEKLRSQKDEEDADDNLASYTEVANTLHGKCDFLVRNFEARQTGQSQEIEGLKGAKAILGGHSFTALLQGRGTGLSIKARESIANALFDSDA